jgi:hypothetical protein
MPVSTIPFNPNNFVAGEPIDNNASNYLIFTPGTIFHYDIRDAGGNLTGTRTLDVTYDTQMVAGVQCIVVIDTVKDTAGNLIEVANDYYAQDKYGNVWYFGEYVENYKNGKLANTDGSWRADDLGAFPGIVMEAQPKVGDQYKQENSPGLAQDYGLVLDLGAKIAGFKGLLQTQDVNPLELAKKTDLPIEQEFKYYKAGVGEVYSVTSILNKQGQYVLAETEKYTYTETYSNPKLVQAMASFGATQSVSSPLTAVNPDQHASTPILAAPHHHS